MENYKIINGDCLTELDSLEENSIDCIITDPPYGLTSITKRFGKEGAAPAKFGTDGAFSRISKGFMGKEWDGSGIEYNVDFWAKALRVLKPGGYLLAFGGSRTFHRIAYAIEDAGFEIRDTIIWLYGSGFPKSMNIGLAVDKKLGKESKVIGEGKSGATSRAYQSEETTTAGGYQVKEAQNEWRGWGTALKPSFEPIIVARKPFKGSLVDNVMEYGVGGLNIDECRISHNEPQKTTTRKPRADREVFNTKTSGFDSTKNHTASAAPKGRFPANTILTYSKEDEAEVCGGFPYTKCGARKKQPYDADKNLWNKMGGGDCEASEGSAARYFMNCKYTGKDEEIWKQLLVNNAEDNSEILEVTKESIAQIDVEDSLKELKSHYAKYVDNQLDLIETPIVQDIVEMLTWDFKIETSQVIRDFIINSKKCIQFLNLVQFVEKMDNIGTTQTTQNLLKLFGYVKVVITNYIQGNIEFDQKRYIYTPKASKKDRDEGLEEFEIKTKVFNGKADKSSREMKDVESRFTTKAHNIHPTVKPTSLMQYLVRLVAPKGATILDPFMGSGSTGKAVAYENKERDAGYKFIGIEKDPEYCDIAEARIKYAVEGKK